MKVSTVSIVMAILCTLSSWRSAEGHDTIAVAVNSSSAIAVSKGPDATGPKAVVPQPSTPQISTPKPSTPSNGGGSSGSNGENPETDKIETTTMSYSKWGDDLLRALDEIYKAMERDNLDRDINALISLIEEYLAKAGASGATTAELDYCLKILIKANGSIDVTVKNSAYNNAFCTLIRIVKE
ncbi:uncharacterized protein LOC105233797 isoform X7 [Bactrocera dorsalis]|uniref:Uncharacterized protein LOC105233797 isoform X7 n=1 Tax=Bactrocera dorsalis TaxID=27457 RepID=A0ABM3J2B0_BACDO|nr:uncharacterized protein LOC105233797 isoform X7 [Bactrocera dorsalis]